MAYAIVQSKNASSGDTSVSAETATPSSGITAGNAVMATVHYGSTTGAIAVSNFKDQANNTLSFVEAGSGIYAGSTEFGTHLCFLYNLGNGITGITVNMASACARGISLLVEEVSGLGATSAALIGNASTDTTATLAANNISSGSATPTSEPAMCYAVSSDDTRSTHSPTAGTSPVAFTAGVNYSHSIHLAGSADGLSENARLTSTSAVAATFTNAGTSGDTCACFMAIIAEASVPVGMQVM